jgi:hypothetical protein
MNVASATDATARECAAHPEVPAGGSTNSTNSADSADSVDSSHSHNLVSLPPICSSCQEEREDGDLSLYDDCEDLLAGSECKGYHRFCSYCLVWADVQQSEDMNKLYPVHLAKIRDAADSYQPLY